MSKKWLWLTIGVMAVGGLVLLAGCPQSEEPEAVAPTRQVTTPPAAPAQAPQVPRRTPDYERLGGAQYGLPYRNGYKVWVSTPQLAQARVIAMDVVQQMRGQGYDEITVFFYPPGVTQPGGDLAAHSFTWSKDTGLKQDF